MWETVDQTGVCATACYCVLVRASPGGMLLPMKRANIGDASSPQGPGPLRRAWGCWHCCSHSQATLAACIYSTAASVLAPQAD